MPLGVKVTTTEVPSAVGTSANTGTAFMIGELDSGPFTTQLVLNMGAFKALYAEERTTTNSSMFDAVETGFNMGCQRIYIQRIQDAAETSAKKAKPTAELLSTGGKKVINVEARYAGTLANKWKIEVVVEGTEAKVVLLNKESEVIEESKLATEAKALLEGKTEFSSTYLTYKEGTEFAGGKAEKLKVLAAVTMEGAVVGTNPTVAESDWEKTPAKISKLLGPGQLLCPGTTGNPIKEKVHTAMGEHALKNNRVALCDIGDSASVATLKTNKGTVGTTIAGYMQYYSSSCIIPGATPGTTRTVAASAVAAGLSAQASGGITNNDNQAPAGRNFPVNNWVTAFTNTFTLAQMTELSEAGINSWAERANIPCLFGFVSALSKEKDLIFWQFSASRERMALVFKTEEIAETFLFQQIDGRKQLEGNFQGRLQGMCLQEWKKNALFGFNAEEAFIVNIAEPVNTPTTRANGELNAELRVRISPFAQAVNIVIVSGPVSEPV